jgi:hypothetical protein
MLSILFFCGSFLPVSAQVYCPPGQYCPPFSVVPTQQSFDVGFQETDTETFYRIFTGPGRAPTSAEIALAERIKGSAVRIYQGNGCGTGSLCGRDDKYIYIMTNAHVASTRIGSVSRCQAIVNGRLEQFSAQVVETAYSTRYRTDWSLLRADASHMAGITPIQLYAELPDKEAITVTWGHPRCNPTQGHSSETILFSTVWYWLPNSIGGQSGSAKVQLVNGVPVQVGLLTWTEQYRGRWVGSGQFISTIRKQSEERTNKAELRTGNEKIPEAAPTAADPLGVELTEGYAVAGDGAMLDVGFRDKQNPLGVQLDEKWAAAGDSQEVSLRNYPIWFDPSNVPVDPVDPPKDDEGDEEEEGDGEDDKPADPLWTYQKRQDVIIATDGLNTVTIIGDIEAFLKDVLQK